MQSIRLCYFFERKCDSGRFKDHMDNDLAVGLNVNNFNMRLEQLQRIFGGEHFLGNSLYEERLEQLKKSKRAIRVEQI